MFGTREFVDDVVRLRNAFDSVFRESAYRGYEYPLVNIYENGDQLTLTAVLPGVNADDLAVELVDNMLVIKGERKSDAEEKPFLKRERSFGSFQKGIKLPYLVDRDSINAKLENGILTVSLEKSEDAKPKKITIN